ncbi:MAG: HNH endonuclease, partial [Methylococcales bacterium]
PLGNSPSMQIDATALIVANQHRFSTYRKDSGELAIAFQPDFIGTYAQNIEALHETGAAPSEVAMLSQIAENPNAITDAAISSNFLEPRRFAVTQTRRALRSLSFSSRVLTAYGHQCAMCGVQLRLIDGAHILPVSEASSTDETSNGVALCALHHRAYDNGFITFDGDYKVHLSEKRADELRQSSRDGKLKEFRSSLRAVMHLPPTQNDRPNPKYIDIANSLRGWGL